MLLLDALGTFDSEWPGRLIDYFVDQTDALFATAPPETTDSTSQDTVAAERRLTT